MRCEAALLSLVKLSPRFNCWLRCFYWTFWIVKVLLITVNHDSPCKEAYLPSINIVCSVKIWQFDDVPFLVFVVLESSAHSNFLQKIWVNQFNLFNKSQTFSNSPILFKTLSERSCKLAALLLQHSDIFKSRKKMHHWVTASILVQKFVLLLTSAYWFRWDATKNLEDIFLRIHVC